MAIFIIIVFHGHSCVHFFLFFDTRTFIDPLSLFFFLFSISNASFGGYQRECRCFTTKLSEGYPSDGDLVEIVVTLKSGCFHTYLTWTESGIFSSWSTNSSTARCRTASEVFGALGSIKWLSKPPDPFATKTQEPMKKVVALGGHRVVVGRCHRILPLIIGETPYLAR